MKLKATFTIEYDARPEDYGTEDPIAAAEADREAGAGALLEMYGIDTLCVSTFDVEPVEEAPAEGALTTTYSGPYLKGSVFQDLGLLQEVNRLVLHPLGLALGMVSADRDETEIRMRVWDAMDDLEGIAFAKHLLSSTKAAAVAHMMEMRGPERVKALGYVVQPVSADVLQLKVSVLAPFKTGGAGEGPTTEDIRVAIGAPGAYDEGEECE